LVCGKVKHTAIEDERLDENRKGRYGKTGYIYNIHSPTNPVDGTEFETKVGFIDILE